MTKGTKVTTFVLASLFDENKQIEFFMCLSFPWPYLWFWKDQWNPETSQDITYSPDSVNVTLKATQKGQIGWKFPRFYPAHACALALKSTWQLRWKQCYQFLTYIMRWNSNAAIEGVFWKKIPQQSGYTVAKLGYSHLRGQSKDKSCNLFGDSKPVKTQVSVTQDGNTLWFRSEKADFCSGFGHCWICFGSEEGF